MIIKRLILKNYRNYDNLDIELSSGINIFIGNNAQGKSSILESIFVLALTKSYMNVKDQNLIKYGRNFSSISGNCSKSGISFKMAVSIKDDGKKLRLDSKEMKKYSDYVSILKVLIFSPYNVNFIKDSPNVRRKNINMVISQYSSGYMNLLQRFNVVLKKRNQYLKNVDFTKDYNHYYLNILNEKYCSIGVEIFLLRKDFIGKINSYLSKIYFEIMGYKNLEIKYVSNIQFFDNKEIMINSFKKNLIDNFEKEKRYGSTMLGIHRDDFVFYLDGKELSIYGSQGQIRVAILALKLAELILFKERDNEYPILLLDDIFSELDIEKRNKLVKYILNDVQTIITTTDIECLDSELISKSKVFSICNGMIVDVRKKECKNE